MDDKDRVHTRVLTDTQLRTLDLLEQNGLNDPTRMKILADMVAQAAAWSIVKKWLIQTAAALGAGAAILTLLYAMRDFFTGGGNP